MYGLALDLVTRRSVCAYRVGLGPRRPVSLRRRLPTRTARVLTNGWLAGSPIPYWLSSPDVSGADVAETTYTCFADTKQALTVQLVVRRVRPTPGSQLALCTAWDYPRLRHRPGAAAGRGRG